MMTQRQFDALGIGDRVRGDLSGVTHTIIEELDGGRSFLAVRLASVTNRHEWTVIEKQEGC